ncbi:MAG: dihydroorotase [Planctomycetes bacterium]|nr:dihydroorotase [Planctomycetota bacterium]
MDSLTIRKPDDLHLHFRDGDILTETVAATARCFARATVMPNLTPPILTTKDSAAYESRIRAAIPEGSDFTPLMTLYLTNDLNPATISEARAAGIRAAKLYPAGATTNSNNGVHDITAMDSVFEAMSACGMLLLIHGEVTDAEIDIFDREKIFIESKLENIVSRHPDLKIVFEHITTSEAAAFVQASPDNVAATITPQHLLLNRNDMLVGGMRPHNFCLPVLKRNTHQEALRAAVASGSAKFFLGSDSAPHEKSAKESACGCAGCYSAWSAIELYAEVFEQLGVLNKLEAFASEHGADFYGLERNSDNITLHKESWTVPEEITLPSGQPIVPFYAGQELSWKLN